MKIWKLVSGILSIIFFALVAMQSCAVGVANTLEDSGEISGSAGILVAVLMLAGGIVSIATRGSEKRGGNIALLVLFGLAAWLFQLRKLFRSGNLVWLVPDQRRFVCGCTGIRTQEILTHLC